MNPSPTPRLPGSADRGPEGRGVRVALVVLVVVVGLAGLAGGLIAAGAGHVVLYGLFSGKTTTTGLQDADDLVLYAMVVGAGALALSAGPLAAAAVYRSRAWLLAALAVAATTVVIAATAALAAAT